MTNKMPVVGKRYRPLQKESFVWAEFKRFSLLNGGVVIFCDLQQVCNDGVSNGYYSCQLKDFWDRFEEVPEVASKDFMEGYNAGWNDFGFKKDYRFKESTDNEPKVIENTNPVDFKKEEVNEVDRALEAEKSLCLKNDQKLDTKEFDSLGLDTKQDMSKPEPKIDIKEEHVDPVSIWKDVSELPEGLLDEGIVKWRRGGHSLMLTAQGKFFDSSGHRVSSGESVAKFISLTDFINSFEQIQKDIEDIKRKFTS
jgi:hypothetical protein